MLILIAILILVSGFLSGSETALTAVNKMKVKSKAEKGDKRSEKLLDMISEPDRMITSILIGNNISNVLLPTLVTMVALQYDFSVGIATGILTVILIIFAEVTPKSIAATFANKIAYIVAPIIGGLIWLLTPLTWLLSKFTDLIINLISKGDKEKASFSREELKTMIEIASMEGTFEREESNRLKGVINFYNRNVLDAMKAPRLDITGIPADATYEETRKIILESSHNRFPVFEGSLDNITGIFHSKALSKWSANPEAKLEEYIERALFVVESASIEKVFKQMLQEKKRMAIVIDEYGGTHGLITSEDIIEVMISQELEDPEDEVLIDEVTDDRIVCHGNLPLRRLNEVFKTRIPENEDIVSGFVYRELGYIPEQGDEFDYHHLHVEVRKVENKRIRQVSFTKQTIEDGEE
ncbi:hemolysin family protein [Pseudalkalibacillus caeni]|uniref:hemolysin family protein n=1 Tax=Exobacillus caeni TaxID=2574798 RepID=UPI001FE6A63E|nr:CNNM domain-containing protein [Pseudalkalibacillus caeni]